ncbi:MAG TPA: hypothetical protein PLF72_14395 [Anaerolineaceae bacterium]|nr:hypothetical protein [Anaerolineaceae bacterium]
MLPDSELNAIRDELERLTLPETAYILSGTLTSDGMGGYTATWGTASTVKCRLDRTNTGYEKASGGGVEPWQGWVLSLPHDTSVTVTNRVKVASTTYAVKAVDSAKSLNCVLRVYLEEVNA